MSGAIDGESVREEVIGLIEGGAETYFLNQRKQHVIGRVFGGTESLLGHASHPTRAE